MVGKEEGPRRNSSEDTLGKIFSEVCPVLALHPCAVSHRATGWTCASQDPQGLRCSAPGGRKKEVVRWDFLPHTTVCLKRKHVEQLCAVGRETEAGNVKVELAGCDSFV